jgi:hypothetical protein
MTVDWNKPIVARCGNKTYSAEVEAMGDARHNYGIDWYNVRITETHFIRAEGEHPHPAGQVWAFNKDGSFCGGSAKNIYIENKS